MGQMMTYQRNPGKQPTETHPTTNKYWTVHLGLLDHINGPASYQFPTQAAAERFAANHQTNRTATIQNPEQ